ncbi:hypothetical protein [Phascolarctobacterium succinatutens]|uniref:hypothetical protein n=1 Tax=Phascolarctobacterium succinatutens TaxID=626940 RepID=UPI0027BA7EDF|nr:hypothetical protein [Phascolarctobacterium succinatutens]
MTVQKDVTKNIYVGNSSTRTFPFTFECPAEHPEYIKVYLMQDDGTALATSDYQLDMDAKQITYPSSGTALPEGKKLVIMRELPLQQMMNLVNNGPYFAEDIETAFDECVMAMQQIAEKLNRSIIMSVDIDGDAFVNEVPFEAGKSFRIADDGKSIVLTEDPAKVLPLVQGVYAQTQAQAQSAAASATAAAKSEDSAFKSAGVAGNSAQYASLSAASASENAELTSGYKQEALTAKADAAASATNAKASEANAKTSENNAEASKEAAQSAATAASNFASAARNSAGEAKTYKDNAKTYMDNAELYMNNAKNYSENVNVFVPSVSSAGVLSWTNKAGLPNPASVNIKGVKGDAGTAATITIGSVTTGEPGTNASVTNSGTSTNAILNFTIPRGNPGSGGGTSVEVDAALSDTSLNPVQNKVIYSALEDKMNTADILSGFALLGGATNIRWREGTQFVGSINAVNYSGTARAATHDGDGNVITSTYAKKTDISGVVKSVNGTAPDESGNVTITATGGVSTSSANTWTAVQEFYNTKTFRTCHTGYFVEGTSDTPVTDTMWYTTNGDFTLNLSNFAMLLGTYESIVFSAYFTADADHALTISGAGTMTYIGSASDIAISGSGTLLTVWMIKNPNGVVSIVQAHKLGSGT